MLYRYFFIAFFLLAAVTTRAQESMLTEVSYPFLEKLIAAAKANYPKVKTFDHEMRIAQLNLQKSKLDWLNLLSFIYIINPSGTTSNSGIFGGFQTGVSVSIGSILQKPGEVKVAREQMAMVKLGQDEYTLSLEAQVQQRYFLFIQQQTLLNWKTKDLQNSESTLKDIKYKFEKGEETFENYNKALTAYSMGIQSKIQAEGAFLMAKSNLEEQIGAKLETIK